MKFKDYLEAINKLAEENPECLNWNCFTDYDSQYSIPNKPYIAYADEDLNSVYPEQLEWIGGEATKIVIILN